MKRKRIVKRKAINTYDKEKLDRQTGINMYKVFGRTNFVLTDKDWVIAKRLRAEYFEGGEVICPAI